MVDLKIESDGPLAMGCNVTLNGVELHPTEASIKVDMTAGDLIMVNLTLHTRSLSVNLKNLFKENFEIEFE